MNKSIRKIVLYLLIVIMPAVAVAQNSGRRGIFGRRNQPAQNQNVQDTTAQNQSAQTSSQDSIGNNFLSAQTSAQDSITQLYITPDMSQQEIFQLARLRSLHNDFNAAAILYCAAARDEPGRVHVAFSSMTQYFAAADSAAFARSLEMFRECALGGDAPLDTVPVRDWLASSFGRRGFFNLEITTLIDLHSPNTTSARRLSEVARHHLSNRRYRLAATAAVAAHDRFDEIEDADLRRSIATSAHAAYLGAGARDSALIWLTRSSAAARDTRIIAAALYQEAGLFDDAEEIIRALTPSLVKDTLAIRRYFFENNPRAVSDALVNARSAVWSMNANERYFWLMRGLIFSGGGGDAAAYIDSVRFASTWHYASEFLRNKYWLLRFSHDSNIMRTWGQLEYYIYLNDLDNVVITMLHNIRGDAGELIAARAAGELAKAGRHDHALTVLMSVMTDTSSQYFSGHIRQDLSGQEWGYSSKLQNFLDDPTTFSVNSPEILFRIAESLHQTGRASDAAVVVNVILQNFPTDIFAQRARLLR